MRGGFPAVEELTKIYDKIYRYCFYKVRNSAAAEDITQETFLRYFAQNMKISRGEDMAYLYTITKNLCTDYFRKKQSEELPEDYPTEEFSGKSDTKIAVRAALEKLDERHREIVLLRYLSGLSVNEAAETMGISRFAAYRLERAALAEMKKYLKGALRYEY
ncbi:MAG: RNA polymerase sigma factor [Oscillospiraceae bacterium]|nr:RNA polymerase sigma factor [Oscillospiraceae bacterium]